MKILPRDDLAKQEVLKEVIKVFEKYREYNEMEVSDILKTLDLEDYVLFRRELVNFGYFQKDSYKGIYVVKTYELTEEQLNKIGTTQSKLKEIE